MLTSTKFDNFRFAVPICWTVDLTSPTQDEWQEQERKYILGFSYVDGHVPHDISRFMAAWAEFFGDFTGVVTDLSHTFAQTFAYLDEIDQAKNGTNTAKGYPPKSKKVKLPPKKTNTGPSWDPHKRGGKGGYR